MSSSSQINVPIRYVGRPATKDFKSIGTHAENYIVSIFHKIMSSTEKASNFFKGNVAGKLNHLTRTEISLLGKVINELISQFNSINPTFFKYFTDLKNIYSDTKQEIMQFVNIVQNGLANFHSVTKIYQGVENKKKINKKIRTGLNLAVRPPIKTDKSYLL
jgi:hypothetical protein